jgi:phenylpropionate dioxygenase-like ring-hydroxylating dioxygenase large terminal subunit
VFEELHGSWTPAATAEQVTSRPLAVVVDGAPIVLFRGREGVGALLDRCPHRGVALSLGRVVDGRLECPFHGWRFERDGACAHVPMNPGARRELLSARALPCRERGGLVWLWCGEAADGEPHVPEALEREGARVTFHVEEWRCHWTRAMENMLDVPHLPYVHRATIGRGMAARLGPESRVEQTIVETDVGFELTFRLDGQPSAGKLRWLRPNGMQLHILDGDARFMRIHVWCVPAGADRTRMVLATSQDFGFLNPLLGVGDFYNRKILREDRAIVESSSPSCIPLDGSEKSVETDEATLRFRKWYRARRAGRDDAR